MALVIRNALVLTNDDAQPVIPRGEILIEGSKIAAVGAKVEAPVGAEVLDAGGMVAMPGLINAHHHLYSSFARGFAPPGEPASNFVQILERMWWKLDLALDAEAVRYFDEAGNEGAGLAEPRFESVRAVVGLVWRALLLWLALLLLLTLASWFA